jgi:glycosyltransferase involved in cell wall biosynthesis
MMHGLPCVGTDTGGVAEAIVDGETGFVVPVGDQDAMTSAIEALRGDPVRRARMGQAAAARARAEYSEKTMADRHERVYRL